MITKKHIPKIRFKGFDEDWEIKPLEEIFLRIRNAFVGTATPYYVSRGHFYLESNNIKNGLINRKTEIFINDDFHYKQKDKWLKTGDIVMVQSGHVGHSAVIPQELNNSAAHALIMFTNYKQETNPYFLNYQFLTDKVKLKIDKVTTGNTIKHILSSDMKPFECSFADIGEQNKIGAFFQNIDQTISLQRRKHKQMQTLKQSLLAKMFPQVGKTEPNIRLKGFSDNWVEVKIGDIFTVTRGHVLSATKLSVKRSCVNSYPVYSSQTKNNGCMGYYNDYLFDTAVTWTTDGANAGTVNFREGKFYSTNVNGVLLSNEGYANQAIAEILNRIAYKHVSKVGNPKLMNNVMAQITINIPSSFEEQNEISQIFKQLDETLALQAKQLKTLDHLKKALLAKMFV